MSKKEELRYIPVQCIICFNKIAYVAENHDDTEYLDLDEFPILCLSCEARTNGS